MRPFSIWATSIPVTAIGQWAATPATGRANDEVGWKVEEQAVNGFRDRLPFAATRELCQSTLSGISLTCRKPEESLVLRRAQGPDTGIGGQAVLKRLAPAGNQRRNRVQSALAFRKRDSIECADDFRQAIGLVHQGGKWQGAIDHSPGLRGAAINPLGRQHQPGRAFGGELDLAPGPENCG